MNGLELRKIRKGLNLTQSQLAKELGVNRVTVTRWETGKSNISRRYEAEIKIVNGITQQAEAQFILLLDNLGPLTMRDFLTCVEVLTEEQVKKYAREGIPELK